MPSNRKYFPNNSVLFISSRTEEGLPIVASLNMNFIIWGILARAKVMYQIKICHFLFMSNHFHMIVVVENPEHVSDFIGYVKGEIAHAINRLLNRRQKTIWQDGYDSPVVLTPQDVTKYIAYIYLNPIKADLVKNIDEYPGVSSWEMFLSGNNRKLCKRICRSSITPLKTPALSINRQEQILKDYQGKEALEYEFVLEPFAWKECFSENEEQFQEETKALLIEEIRKVEEELYKKRKQHKKSVIGCTSLRRESMLKEYSPKNFGRKMICLCTDILLRKLFISEFRNRCKFASAAYRSWMCGDFSMKIPAGLFSPRLPNLVSALTLF